MAAAMEKEASGKGDAFTTKEKVRFESFFLKKKILFRDTKL